MAKSRLKGMKKAKFSKSVKDIKRASKINASRHKKQRLQKQRSATLTNRQKRQLQHDADRNAYTAGQKILLLGEGNFSFAKALCAKLGPVPGVIATCYDSKEVCNKKYSDARANKLSVRKMNGEVVHKVDATKLLDVHNGLFRENFDRIVFNFPHLGHGEKDQEVNILDHQQFLESFFRSAVQCLRPPPAKAEIHVTLKEGEPYKSWKVAPACTRGAPTMEVKTAIPFSTQQWPGYEHRRTIGFEPRFSTQDNLDIEKGAKTYIFGYKKDASHAEE